MLTEALIATILEQSRDKILEFAAESGGGYVRDALTARLDRNHQFQRALEHEREAILWTLHAALQATVRSVFGRELSVEQVTNLLFKLAGEPDSHRRFRSLLNAAVQSSEERIAMLAVGYFVGARSTALRERIDSALLGLFPDDAEVLGHVLELLAKTTKRSLLVVEYPASEAHADKCLLCALQREQPEPESLAMWVSAQSLRALDRAQCIALSDGVVVGDSTGVPGSPGGPERHRALEVLPMGQELNRILEAVDWRSIRAAQRG